MSNFDTRKFEAVCKLMREGATEGEREAAQSAAERMASKAGMTLEEALTRHGPVSTPETPRPTSIFEAMFSSPEFQEIRQERERDREKRRKEALAKYGSEDAIFAETQNEAILSSAVEEYKIWDVYMDDSGNNHPYVDSLEGYSGTFNIAEVEPVLVKRVRDAYPVPQSLRQVLNELNEWDEIYLVRQLFEPVEHWPWVQLRCLVLEKELSERPVESWDDLAARMEWIQLRLEDGPWGTDWLLPLHQRLVQDHQILQDMSKAPVQNGPSPRTNAQKADAVLQLIQEMPSAPAREIARRAGVSPQTVLNWKRRVQV